MFPMSVYEKNIYSKTRIWNDINRLIEDRTDADFVFRIEASWNSGYPPVWSVSTDGDFDGAFWKDFNNCQEALLYLDRKLSQLIYNMYAWAKGNYDNPNPVARGEAKDVLEVLKKHNWIEKEKGELDDEKKKETKNSTANTPLKKGGTCMARNS
jgi:hypothetical protein